jgi:hypothetical protein
MFGLFKKSRWKIQGSAFSILEDIFNNLPPEYAFLASGLKNGVYKNYNTNVSLKIPCPGSRKKLPKIRAQKFRYL